MPKSFSDFVLSSPKKTTQDFEQPPVEKKESLESMVNSLQGKSQEELLSTLKKEVSAQKENGTFNLEKLQQNLDLLSPFLSQEQKTNIKELLKQF